jgi:hypothetical protein
MTPGELTTIAAWRKARDAGLLPKPLRNPAPPPLPGRLVLILELPFRTRAETNDHAHWRERDKRSKAMRRPTELMLQSRVSARAVAKLELPIHVRITRVAPCLLDDGDNLSSALKAVRDGVADWLGIDDKSTSPVKWDYQQQQRSKAYAVLVEVRQA